MWGRGLARVPALHGGVWWLRLLLADSGSVYSECGKLRLLPGVAELLDQPGQRGQTPPSLHLLIIITPPYTILTLLLS